jgi:hypothetical protein
LQWSALNLAPLLTKSSLGTLVDEAWSTLDAQLKLRFLFALRAQLRFTECRFFAHVLNFI